MPLPYEGHATHVREPLISPPNACPVNRLVRMRERRGQSREAEAGSRFRELSAEERLKIEPLSGDSAAETT